MCEVRYTLDPDVIKGKESTIKANMPCDDSIVMKYEKHCKLLDLTMFLIDYWHIITFNSQGLCGFQPEEYPEFWKANNYLLNYVNAIYCLKEFINHKLATKKKAIKKISDKYYNNNTGWYRFICDYRNYVVHESTLLRNYRSSDKELLFSIDQVIEELRAFTDSDEDREERKKEFIKKLKDLYPLSKKVRGRHYIPISYLIDKINSEVRSLFEETINKVYDCLIEDSLKWMISHIYRIGDFYTYTIIDVDFEKDLIFEPNYTLEYCLDYFMINLGEEHEIVQKFIKLLREKKYTLLYDSHMKIDGFDNRLLIEDSNT